ncbi:MAG TPA: Uma2 family endonuclease [Polyangiaceae bacterium]|nr:Uma2 family endonuclease [Polyangiaceae bacterium]
MVAKPKPRATYKDVLDAPEHVVAEILFGVLYTFPRPAPRHARASSRLATKLGASFDDGEGGPGGWAILEEPEIHFGKSPDEDIVVPDLAGWRRTRLKKLPEEAYFTLAPDWICEVLSSSTQAVDRSDKMTIYAREGVKHAWLVDPIARTLEAYKLRAKAWVRVKVFRDEAKLRADPFAAIELDLARLWKL